MQKRKLVAVVISIAILSLALVRTGGANSSDGLQTFFSKDYVNISVRVDATNQTDPGGSITIRLFIDCWTTKVTVDSFNITVYGFESGKEKTLIRNVTLVAARTPLAISNITEYECVVPVPNNVWDATYATIDFRGTYERTGESYSGSETFSLTVIRNAYLALLEQQLENLTRDYEALNESHRQLDDTYRQLNSSYWDLQHELNASKVGAADLDNTRRAATLLGVTTVFFVASTLYLIFRKPKEYW